MLLSGVSYYLSILYFGKKAYDAFEREKKREKVCPAS